MGTDIHLHVERRVGGVWRAVLKPIGKYGEPRWDKAENRDYFVFAILAGVRNNHEFVPIALPRGLPEDLSRELRDDGEWQFYHTHSWLTLAEIRDYDWSRVATISGIVPLLAYAQWRANNGRSPLTWCRSVSGGKTFIISEEELKSIKIFFPFEDRSIYVDCRWKMIYRECAKYFLEFCHEMLEPLGAPEDVRIVFCFDS